MFGSWQEAQKKHFNDGGVFDSIYAAEVITDSRVGRLDSGLTAAMHSDVEQHAQTRSVLPGFGLTMGYTVLYLSLVVLIAAGGARDQEHRRWAGSEFWARPRGTRASSLVQADVRHVARRRDDQRRLRPHGGLDAGSLHDSRQEVHRRAGRFAVRVADGRLRHRADGRVLARTAGSASTSNRSASRRRSRRWES